MFKKLKNRLFKEKISGKKIQASFLHYFEVCGEPLIFKLQNAWFKTLQTKLN